MIAKDDRKNAEGYNDPTAYNAIKNVEQEQDKDDMRFHQLLNTLFSLCELADFHIEGRVVCSTWLMIAVDVNRIPILMNYCRSELDFGAVTMQWFKRTAKSPKYH